MSGQLNPIFQAFFQPTVQWQGRNSHGIHRYLEKKHPYISTEKYYFKKFSFKKFFVVIFSAKTPKSDSDLYSLLPSFQIQLAIKEISFSLTIAGKPAMNSLLSPCRVTENKRIKKSALLQHDTKLF